MAWDFDGTADHLNSGTSAAFSATYPTSLACWFNTDVTGIADWIIDLGDGTNNNHFSLKLGPAFVVEAEVRDSVGTTTVANSSTTITGGVWQHAAAVFSANNSKAAFLNGANKGTDANTANVGTINIIAIGAFYNGAILGEYDGRLAEMAIWNVALTDAEVATLGAGYSPLFVRPQNLVHYVSMRDAALVNHKGGAFANGAFGSDAVFFPSSHPPITYPSSAQLRALAATVEPPVEQIGIIQQTIEIQRVERMIAY
jgi:hypothetical protein